MKNMTFAIASLDKTTHDRTCVGVFKFFESCRIESRGFYIIQLFSDFHNVSSLGLANFAVVPQ